MKKKRNYKAGLKFGEWILESKLGKGGNGEVWLASQNGRSDYAIKLLHKIDGISYKRFCAEVAILNMLEGVSGIIPIVDSHLPNYGNNDTPWFVMPRAVPFEKYEIDRSPLQLIKDFIELSNTLSILHQQQIFHRDIKPSNILFFGDRLCFSDFGLVKYPNRSTFTTEREDVGPKFTMAPEMRRCAAEAEGGPADVYSFSKTIWIALTKQTKGFDGQYKSADSILSINNYHPLIYTTTLDRILVECTDNDPFRRPQIQQISDRLHEWTSIIGDPHRRNLTEWTEMQHTLFPLGSPKGATWSQIDSICAVIDEIAKVPALNHMFYPTGGGNTITGVSRATESGMIAIHAGDLTEVIKPAKLTYESFGADSIWNYFRLEVAITLPTGIKGAVDKQGIRETLTEVSPGNYAPLSCWENGEYRDHELSSKARQVSRYLKGSFVFFSTRSIYNQESSTYDARHYKMTEEAFREYVEQSARFHFENYEVERSQ